jgi:HK97 family phage prohead protease
MTNKIFYLNSSFEAKSVSKATKSLKIAGYANTTAKDRSGDVVTAEAWAKGVENFRKNPVMLYQHKHDCPIGRFDKITVDKKGIYVEGTVSEAAEKNFGIHTLINDGALKSFSVGFRVKDGKYNRNDDSMLITDVELLEISVVSVPCNQESLFSVRKSFETSDDYTSFIETFTEATEDEQKMIQEYLKNQYTK